MNGSPEPTQLSPPLVTPAGRGPSFTIIVIAAIVVILAGLAVSGVLAEGITTIFWEALKAVVVTLWSLLQKF